MRIKIVNIWYGALLAFCNAIQIIIILAYILNFTNFYTRRPSILFLHPTYEAYFYIPPNATLYRCYVLIFFLLFGLSLFYLRRWNQERKIKGMLTLIKSELLWTGLMLGVSINMVLGNIPSAWAGPSILLIIGLSLIGKWFWHQRMARLPGM